MNEPIPDLNLFMMCTALNREALRPLPEGLHFRHCRRDELPLWKRIHFDEPRVADEYYGYMGEYFENVYAPAGDRFFEVCLFVCTADDTPIGTCFLWKAYGRISTIHWYKVLKGHEGRGIGRALLSQVMADRPGPDAPVYLHTQPSSYRAIKLYSDFGFALITDPMIGPRENHLARCLPILEQYMPPKDFAQLRFAPAGADLLAAAGASELNEF